MMKGGEDIYDPAAHAEVAPLLSLGDSLIAHRCQGVDQCFQVQTLGQSNRDHIIVEGSNRYRTRHQRLYGRYYQWSLGAPQCEQGGKLCCLCIGWWRQMGKRAQLPSWQELDPGLRRIAFGRLIEEKAELASE